MRAFLLVLLCLSFSGVSAVWAAPAATKTTSMRKASISNAQKGKMPAPKQKKNAAGAQKTTAGSAAAQKGKTAGEKTAVKVGKSSKKETTAKVPAGTKAKQAGSKEKSATKGKNAKTVAGKKTGKRTGRNAPAQRRGTPSLQRRGAGVAATAAGLVGGMGKDEDIPLRGLAPLASNAGRLTRISLGKTVQASQFQNNTWLLPAKTRKEAAAVVASFAPQFITGVIRLEPGFRLSTATVNTWNSLRNAVRSKNAAAGFDIVVDVRRYPTAEALVKHMQEVEKLLVAEAWTFDGMAGAAQAGLVQAGVAEAKKQGRFAGVVLGNGPVPAGADYVMVAAGQGAEGLQRGRGQAGGVPVVALSGVGTPGAAFANGKTPAERRKMVIAAAKAQQRSAAFAYPVFALAGGEKVYDAARDEFMLDTINRCMRQYHSGDVGATLAR